jgi:hypothetical protein
MCYFCKYYKLNRINQGVKLMHIISKILKPIFWASSKRLLSVAVLLLLFVQTLFAVNESGSPNINSGDYEYRATDITWTSGTINLAGGTLEIEGNFTVSSGATLNFNSGTLIVKGSFTYNNGDFNVNNGTLYVGENLTISSGNMQNNSTGLVIVMGNLTTSGTLGSDGNLVVAGNLDTNGNNVTNNNDQIYVFGTSDCSGSGCSIINDYDNWQSLTSPPGQPYFETGDRTYIESGTFTVPFGVYAINVEAWGAGAGGTNDVGDGGGGGAYAAKVIAVNPGDVYNLTIGSGGSSGGGNGGNTIFDSNTVLAAGAQGQTGGSAGDCEGGVAFSGGNGGNGGGNSGGGGGGSAWSDTNGGTGGNGGGNTGGTAGTGTGYGGTGGGGNNSSGQNGNPPGGGGGGGGNKAVGGNGANGQISISWSDLPYIYFTSASTSIIESNTTLNIEVEISSTSTSTVSVNFSVTTNIATAGTDYSILTSSPISISPGSTTTTISVQIIDDSIEDQFEESITLTLNNPTNASLGTPATHTINIIENEFSDPSLVVAPTEICITNQVVFTADPPKGNCGQITAFYYSTDGSTWQQIPNNQLTNNGCDITYTPPTAGNFFYYYEHSNFGNSNAVGVIVNNTPAQPGSITGATTQCPNISGEIYSIDPVTYADDYTWTVPANWSITAGQGTTEITVTTGDLGDNGNIEVTANNACGSSSASTLPVTVADTEDPTFTSCPGNQTVDANFTGCTYQVPNDNSLDATATDNCVVASITHDYNGGGNSLNGELFPVGTTTVTWTATDGGGLESTCSFDITVNSISATISQITPDNECPQLDPALGFEPNNDGPYDAGSSEIQFQIQNNSPTTDWNFTFDISDANGTTGFLVDSVNAAGNDSYNQDILNSNGTFSSIPVADDLITITTRVKNIPGSQLEIDFNLSNITDTNGCSTSYTENRDTVIMNVMPVVGSFE